MNKTAITVRSDTFPDITNHHTFHHLADIPGTFRKPIRQLWHAAQLQKLRKKQWLPGYTELLPGYTALDSVQLLRYGISGHKVTRQRLREASQELTTSDRQHAPKLRRGAVISLPTTKLAVKNFQIRNRIHRIDVRLKEYVNESPEITFVNGASQNKNLVCIELSMTLENDANGLPSSE